MVYINAEEGTAGVRAALEGGAVDAAALWDPDLALALRNVKGAHVVYSTKTATNLIFDVMVCDSRLLAKPEGQAVVHKFVAGWMDGVEELGRACQSRQRRRGAGADTGVLQAAGRQGRPCRSSGACSPTWCGPAVEDNARILGLAGGTNHYERVYKRFRRDLPQGRGAGQSQVAGDRAIRTASTIASSRRKLDREQRRRWRRRKEPQETFTESAARRGRRRSRRWSPSR
jgi:hypothetical protein